MPMHVPPAKPHLVSSLDEVSGSALLTIAECAHILRCTYGTVHELVQKGEILSIRVSAKNIRVRASDLRAYLDARVRGRRREPLFPPMRAHRATSTS